MGLDGNQGESHWYTVDHGYYGNWKEWSETELSYFVCGVKVRYQHEAYVDETGINGIKFELCH